MLPPAHAANHSTATARQMRHHQNHIHQVACKQKEQQEESPQTKKLRPFKNEEQSNEQLC